MGRSDSQERRERLLKWMRQWKLSSGHTVAPVSDLKRLEAEGKVRRLPGRYLMSFPLNIKLLLSV